MNHQRHLIREAITALLTAGGTAAGTRVFENPYAQRTTFPDLVVTDGAEAQQATSLPAGPARTIERRLFIEVAASVHQSDNYARQRDQLLAEVEVLLAGAAIAGVKSIAPVGFEPDFSTVGERPIAVGRQRFEVLYFTPQGAPATSL